MIEMIDYEFDYSDVVPGLIDGMGVVAVAWVPMTPDLITRVAADELDADDEDDVPMTSTQWCVMRTIDGIDSLGVPWIEVSVVHCDPPWDVPM
jgi:hypothetical protein